MIMTEGEILLRFRRNGCEDSMLQILAELNATKKETITHIIEEAGYRKDGKVWVNDNEPIKKKEKKKTMKMITESTKAKAYSMWQEGYTGREISDKLKISVPSVRKYVRQKQAEADKQENGKETGAKTKDTHSKASGSKENAKEVPHHEQIFSIIDDEIAQINKKIPGLKDRISGLENEIVQINVKIKRLNNDLTESNRELTTLNNRKDELTDAKQKIKDLLKICLAKEQKG